MIVAAFFAVGAIFLGAVVVFFLVGFGLLVWLFIRLRFWWLRRQMGNATPGAPAEFVEVEYTVVGERSPDAENRGGRR